MRFVETDYVGPMKSLVNCNLILVEEILSPCSRAPPMAPQAKIMWNNFSKKTLLVLLK